MLLSMRRRKGIQFHSMRVEKVRWRWRTCLRWRLALRRSTVHGWREVSWRPLYLIQRLTRMVKERKTLCTGQRRLSISTLWKETWFSRWSQSVTLQRAGFWLVFFVVTFGLIGYTIGYFTYTDPEIQNAIEDFKKDLENQKKSLKNKPPKFKFSKTKNLDSAEKDEEGD